MKTRLERKYFIPAIVFLMAMMRSLYGQSIAVNSGVDTTDKDAKAVVKLWTDYLKSNPNKDNIKGSGFWAESEMRKYPKVDQLLNAISTDGPTYGLFGGNATILYVKPWHDYIEIKTLFGASDSLQNIDVLCITSVFAKKENGEYKLYNALTVRSGQWQQQRVGSITFHYPGAHLFDPVKAGTLIRSVEDLALQWKLQVIPVDYYFADTYEEIQHLRGLDYSIGMGNKDKPSGMSDLETNAVFAGGLGENYFHEVVHLYLNRLFSGSPLVEGLAVFYGGSMGNDLQWHLARLDAYLDKHEEIKLNEIENFGFYLDNFTNPNSTIQGLLCYIAFKRGGIDQLRRLVLYNDIEIAIEKEFGIKRDNLNSFLREQIKLNKK